MPGPGTGVKVSRRSQATRAAICPRHGSMGCSSVGSLVGGDSEQVWLPDCGMQDSQYMCEKWPQRARGPEQTWCLKDRT